MKRIFAAILAVLLLCAPVLLWGTPRAFALEDSDVFSNEAYVVNMDTDEVLYAKNTNTDSVAIASLTKVMTFVLAMENISDPNTQITVPDGTEASMAEQGASTAKLQDGYTYSVKDLLYGLMLPSGCDAAEVLAQYISGDQDAFVALMNQKAQQLGMTNTVYNSASGLERNGNNTYSTEQDLYLLAKYAFSMPLFKEIIGTEFYDIVGTKDGATSTRTVQNTNYLIGDYNGAEYYYIYSQGGKTGNLSIAGRCLISFAQKGSLNLVAITLGVPNEHDNYHLTDHIKLFEYIFAEFSENITIDIGAQYQSVGIGETLQMTPETSQETTVTWKSSDPAVASIDENGVLTGHQRGQVEITAVTQTGNLDNAYVSVGFYNGIDIKYSAGPSDPDGFNGYGLIDWSVVKKAGLDFAVIRAGYASGNNPDSDPYFVANIENAFANDMHVIVSFDGYALNETHAQQEASYLADFLTENIPAYLDRIETPIVYNLDMSSVSDGAVLTQTALAFREAMAAYGYDRIIVKHNRSVMNNMDLQALTDAGMALYMTYKPYYPNFAAWMQAVNGSTEYSADLWLYRGDAYFGPVGIGKRINMSAMDMAFMELGASREENPFPAKPQITVEGTYTYNGSSITANVLGFDPDTMRMEGNVATNAGTYTVTVTPVTQWQDGSTDGVSATWCIEKATPVFDLPAVQAPAGTALKQISLPDGFAWEKPNQIVTIEKDVFRVVYTPADTDNYLTVTLSLTIDVLASEDDSEDDFREDSREDSWDTEQTQPAPEDTDETVTEPTEETVPETLPPQETVEAQTPAQDTPQQETEGATEPAQDTLQQEHTAEKTLPGFLLIGSAVVGVLSLILLLVLILKRHLAGR